MPTTKKLAFSIDSLTPKAPIALIHGDACDIESFSRGCVDAVFTSPPYYGLRDYGVSGQIGAESSSSEYVNNIVEVFRIIHPVLKDSGSVWLNIGDTYSVNQLLGIPWRVALALQARCAYAIVSANIWHKPDAMTESTKTRPNRSHEYVFQFTKLGTVPYYDWFGVRQKGESEYGRNLRSVWSIPKQSYKGAHFAAFPEKLCETVIQAATSDGGYCSACGRPYLRTVHSERIPTRPGRTTKVGKNTSHGNRDTERHITKFTDGGFHGACDCSFPSRPGVILDPFCGSGTAVGVAAKMGRYAIGIDLNPEYLKLARARIGKIAGVRPPIYTSIKPRE